MSDKSPKELHKRAEQKKHKDDVLHREKEEVTEALHHPVSGHPTTHAEAAEERAQSETDLSAQDGLGCETGKLA